MANVARAPLRAYTPPPACLSTDSLLMPPCHSCGERCERPAQGCGHPCMLLCHPGECRWQPCATSVCSYTSDIQATAS